MCVATRSDRAASVCYLAVYKSSDWDVFFYLLGGTERHTETFSIAPSKNQSKSYQKVKIKRLTRSRIHLNGLFSPTA